MDCRIEDRLSISSLSSFFLHAFAVVFRTNIFPLDEENLSPYDHFKADDIEFLKKEFVSCHLRVQVLVQGLFHVELGLGNKCSKWPVINQFSLASLIMWKDVLTIIHVAINVHSPCFHVLMRTPQLDRGISHVGKGTPDRKRNLEGGRDGNCLDLVVLVRSLSLPLAKIKVIVLTTLVYDNTRRQFSKRIIFRSFHEASAQHEKQHEFTLQNSWLFLPGDYPLTTDTEVKKLDFYAISASKARVLILIGWESGEKILNQSQIRKVQNQIFSTKTAPKSWYLLNSL